MGELLVQFLVQVPESLSCAGLAAATEELFRRTVEGLGGELLECEIYRKYEEVSGPGTYQVAVFEPGSTWESTWTGQADSDEDARSKALGVYAERGVDYETAIRSRPSPG